MPNIFGGVFESTIGLEHLAVSNLFRMWLMVEKLPWTSVLEFCPASFSPELEFFLLFLVSDVSRKKLESRSGAAIDLDIASHILI